MKVKFRKATESLFTKGGTVQEDYIEVSKKNRVIDKIGLSNFITYNRYNVKNKIVQNDIKYFGKCIDGIDYIILLNTKTKKTYIKKVLKCDNHSYRFQKTQVKAMKGLDGFIDFINKANEKDSAFNGFFYRVLEDAIEEYQPI